MDRALTGEELMIELLRQYFNVTDPAIARKVMVDEDMTLPEGFVVPAEDVTKGFYVINITGIQQLQLELAVKKYGVTPPVRGEVPKKTPTRSSHHTPSVRPTRRPPSPSTSRSPTKRSRELADAVKRHIELMPDEKQVRPPKEEEPSIAAERINAALEKLTPDQRKLFVLLAEPTDNLDLYEESVRSVTGIIDGCEEALRSCPRGRCHAAH